MAASESSIIRVLTGSISVAFDTWLPYAAGTLISYAKKHFTDNEVVFFSPLYKALTREELISRLENVDILALTCYVWNEEINSEYSQIFKKINPKGLVIWGGPNIPKENKTFNSFSERYPQVDTFVCGPGEDVFVNIIENFKQKKIAKKRIDGSRRLLPENIETNAYLDGSFDQIFSQETQLKASFETNRGCPYSCSFCDWGGQSRSRIHLVPKRLTEKTIDFLFSKMNIKEIEILDANFGMFRDDLETIKKMIVAKNKYQSNPNISYSGLAKNGSKYLPVILELFNKNFNVTNWQLKVSFQTHSEKVLKLAARENIKSEKLVELLRFGQTQGLNVCSEMILGLPGETSTSWSNSLSRDISLGINLTRAYILTVSENTLIADTEYKKKNGILCKEIFFPDFRNQYKGIDGHSFGNQRHRVVYECFSYDLNELRKMYRVWWFHHTFYNAKILPNVLKVYLESGGSYLDLIESFLDEISENSIFARLLHRIDEFVKLYFKPEPETKIDNYNYYRFASGSMRFSDIYDILQSANEAKELIKSFFSHQTKDKHLLTVLENDLRNWDLSLFESGHAPLRGPGTSIRGKNVEKSV